MKTKIILLIALLASTLPINSHAWGRKKKDPSKQPENAWLLLLETNNPVALNETETVQTEQQPIKESTKKHKTAPQQFAAAHALLTDADKARAENDIVTAMWLYDKAIKSYITMQDKYPDWQPAVMSFRRNHCEYHLKELLKQANKGDLELDPTTKQKKPNRSKQKNATALSKAKYLLMENKNEEARDILIKTLMTDPDNTRIRLMIGIAQCRLKNYHDASYLLETLIEEHPDNANAHVVLATAYFGMNRYEDVVAQLNQALELDSFHKEANFNMAKILLKTTPDDTESIAKYYIKAVELGSNRDPKLDAAIIRIKEPCLP